MKKKISFGNYKMKVSAIKMTIQTPCMIFTILLKTLSFLFYLHFVIYKAITFKFFTTSN